MAEPSKVYQTNVPALTQGGLTSLQLALANYMAIGSPPPFAVNQAFLEIMNTYSDSGVLSPFDLDTRTGLPRIPDLKYTTSEGIAYIAKGEDMYLLRRAQDCGPNENRFEEVYIGRRPDVAEGTWAFYGRPIGSGSVSDQTGYGYSDYGPSPPGVTPGGTFGTAPPGQDVGSNQPDGGGFYE